MRYRAKSHANIRVNDLTEIERWSCDTILERAASGRKLRAGSRFVYLVNGLCVTTPRVDQTGFKGADVSRAARVGFRIASTPGRSRLLRERLRAWLRPELWTHHQHAPRPLKDLDELPTSAAAWPRFAIVTPSLNSGSYIGSTIQSVLQQDYPALDYSVQDGGSRDATLSVMAAYGDRLAWRSRPDDGQADAVNLALAETSGDIMGWLNADDLYLPGCLRRVAQAFADHPDIDVVYGHRLNINAHGLQVGHRVLPSDDAAWAPYFNLLPQETLFWRRRVWEKLRGLDPAFSFAMDWDFTLRAREAGFRFLRLDAFLAAFRAHPDQKTVRLRQIGVAESDALQRRYLGRVVPDAEIVFRALPVVARSARTRLRLARAGRLP